MGSIPSTSAVLAKPVPAFLENKEDELDDFLLRRRAQFHYDPIPDNLPDTILLDDDNEVKQN
jgi:hypothetical protein